MCVTKHETFFREHAVFTGRQVREYLNAQGYANPHRCASLLAYYKKTGRIIQIRRGLYASIPLGSNPDTYPVDRFLVTSNMVPDAVLAYHSALEFHGMAYSAWNHCLYAASRPVDDVRFRSQRIRGTAFPRPLTQARAQHYAVLELPHRRDTLRVTSLERTLVDVLDRPHLAGGWEEIWRSLEMMAWIDVEQVVEYVLLLRNATAVAKVGFYLDQHREELMLSDRHLMPLREHIPRQPVYWHRSDRTPGRLATAWNIVVPEAIWERAWDEFR